MGSQGKTNLAKLHYNISMSKRTRKPQHLKIEPRESFEEIENFIINKEKNIQEEKISLKELIEGRCTLAQHFKEEENHQGVVIKPCDEDGLIEGVKFKKIVRNYARVLSHLVKVNQECYFRSLRKATPSFKLIKHK